MKTIVRGFSVLFAAIALACAVFQNYSAAAYWMALAVYMVTF